MEAARSIRPTLTDVDVLDFCKKGFLILHGVIPNEVNRWVYDYLEEHPNTSVNEILKEDYFVNNVLLNSELAGVIRSLLGKSFRLPINMSNHRADGQRKAGNWHQDQGSIPYPPTCNYLQVFYYPQDVSDDMGPTALLPGTHLMEGAELGHFGSIKGQVFTSAQAGSVFITSYPIWHRATNKPNPATRNLLKWCYWRTVPPERDWIADPSFDPETADYGCPTYVGQSRWPHWSVAEMFFWMCGKKQLFNSIGGQDWLSGTISDPASSADEGRSLFWKNRYLAKF